MIAIYKIISPKNRIYIGQSRNVDKRFKDYQSGPNYCKGQIRLYNSFKKYGIHSHQFEIIEECLLENLDLRERFWQEYYDVLSSKGLNCSYVCLPGEKPVFSKRTSVNRSRGQKRRIVTEETRRKIGLSWEHRTVTQLTRDRMSAAALGKEKSESHCKNISKGRKGIGHSVESRNRMRFKTPEHLEKIRQLSLKRRKPVEQFTLDDKFIQDWNSSMEAHRSLDIANQNINKCCNGKAKTAGGFRWKFKKT